MSSLAWGVKACLALSVLQYLVRSGNYYLFISEVSGNATKPKLVIIFHSLLLPISGKRRKFRGVEKYTNQM